MVIDQYSYIYEHVAVYFAWRRSFSTMMMQQTIGIATGKMYLLQQQTMKEKYGLYSIKDCSVLD